MSPIGELVGGVLGLIVGALMVVFRRQFGSFIQAQQRQMFGRLGRAATGSPATVPVAVVGSFAVLLGIVFIVGSVIRLSS